MGWGWVGYELVEGVYLDVLHYVHGLDLDLKQAQIVLPAMHAESIFELKLKCDVP